jgi:Family of unknown function (DUF5681)
VWAAQVGSVAYKRTPDRSSVRRARLLGSNGTHHESSSIQIQRRRVLGCTARQRLACGMFAFSALLNSMPAESTTPKQRRRPFEKGRSGNPLGRPRGARNHATLIAEKLLDGEAAAITREVIDLAKAGDRAALRLCMDRILPPRRCRTARLSLPQLNSAADASKALSLITTAAVSGEIGIDEAAELSKLIETYVRAIEATDLEKRLLALEQRFK